MKTTNLTPAQQAKNLNAITRIKPVKPSNKTGIKTYIEVSQLVSRLVKASDKIGIFVSETYDFPQSPKYNIDKFAEFVFTRSKIQILNHVAYFSVVLPTYTECKEIGFFADTDTLNNKQFYNELLENNFFLFAKSKLRQIIG